MPPPTAAERNDDAQLCARADADLEHGRGAIPNCERVESVALDAGFYLEISGRYRSSMRRHSRTFRLHGAEVGLLCANGWSGL